MAINRWIGRAAARQEVKLFVPSNINPGDRFQLSDGVLRYGATYPEVGPEADLTDADRAMRICTEILSQTSSANPALAGGGDSELIFSLSNSNGSPAIQVTGATDGKPISLVASANPATANPILVQQTQAGSSGKDFVFTLTWPNVPSQGRWAISADGKKPVILEYNASAATLKSAIDSFGLPYTTSTVTGSHSVGYTVTLAGLTDALPNPPVMFPIVPPASEYAVVEFTLFEDRTYRFAAAGYSDMVFEASISASQLKADLSALIGSTLANNINVTRTEITPTSGYTAGALYQLTFLSSAAYVAFNALTKKVINYNWSAADGFYTRSESNRHVYVLSYTIPDTRYKIRHKPIQQLSPFGTLNPFDRYWHTVSFTPAGGHFGAGVSNSFVINTVPAGQDNVLSTGRPHILSFEVPTNVVMAVTSSFNDGSGDPWVLASNEIETRIGIFSNETDLAISVTADGVGLQLGVNNNAGYTIDTIQTPGIINQEILMPLLDGKIGTRYQFVWDGKRSHMFTGASSIALIKDAAESLWGVNNVVVSAEPNYACRIQFVSRYSETPIITQLQVLGGDGTTLMVDIEASTPMQSWKLEYKFTGGVCSGTWRFKNEAGVPSSTVFEWLQDGQPSAGDIYAAILGIMPEYEAVLDVSDITVVTEEVGRKYLIRSFVIDWQAQPQVKFAGPTAIPFWLDLDVSNLLTAEPSYATVAVGEPTKPEVQVVALLNKPTSGWFKLNYNGTLTADIAYNAAASVVQSAINATGQAVTVIGANGGPYRVRWNSAGARVLLAGVNVSLAASAAPVFSERTIQSGTGPKHFDNADNWSLGHTPADTEDVVFADGSVDCSYGLVCTTKPRSIDIYRSWSGNLGLPEVREDGSLETLPNWLSLAAVEASALLVRVGLGDTGEGPTIARIQVENRPFNANVLYAQTGNRERCIGIKGSNASNKLVLVQGDLALGVRPEDVANCPIVQIVPSTNGDTASFSSSASADIASARVLGGSATFGKTPTSLIALGGQIVVNGAGRCDSLDIANTTVDWLASGTLGKSGLASAVLFGGGLASSAAQNAPTTVRITSNGHGLLSGQRVYIRSTGGVIGLNGNVYSVQVVDANNFDLVGSSAYGTYTGYAGTLHWGVSQSIVVRSEATLNFDSDSTSRDVVPPIVVQGTGRVTDAKATVVDLRLWPEQVSELLYMGTSIELRRTNR